MSDIGYDASLLQQILEPVHMFAWLMTMSLKYSVQTRLVRGYRCHSRSPPPRSSVMFCPISCKCIHRCPLVVILRGNLYRNELNCILPSRMTLNYYAVQHLIRCRISKNFNETVETKSNFLFMQFYVKRPLDIAASILGRRVYTEFS